MLTLISRLFKLSECLKQIFFVFLFNFSGLVGWLLFCLNSIVQIFEDLNLETMQFATTEFKQSSEQFLSDGYIGNKS